MLLIGIQCSVKYLYLTNQLDMLNHEMLSGQAALSEHSELCFVAELCVVL